jgi:hypothetical protein
MGGKQRRKKEEKLGEKWKKNNVREIIYNIWSYSLDMKSFLGICFPRICFTLSAAQALRSHCSCGSRKLCYCSSWQQTIAVFM